MSVGNNSAGAIKAYIDRVEKLEEEKAAIATDIKEVYAEAKGNGFDTKTLREIIKRRRMDADERAERDHMLELYEKALNKLIGLDEDEDSEDDV